MVSYTHDCIEVRINKVSLNPYCSGRWSRTSKRHGCWETQQVLILIVVEDGLVQAWKQMQSRQEGGVLILIVVEDGLVHSQFIATKFADMSLNPYCSGRWSRTLQHLLCLLSQMSLNPYCSGRWSRTGYSVRVGRELKSVLILIVVEDGLVQW